MYEQIRRNRRASWLLMGFVVALLAALGYAIGAAVVGGNNGGIGLLGVFGIVAIAWSILGYYSGDKMVLAVSGAHQVTHEQRAAALQRGRGDDDRRRPAQRAGGLRHRGAGAQRLRHRPRPAALLHRRHARDDADARPRRAAGRRRARDVAHPQLRHPLRHARRHPRRHDRPGGRLLPALQLLRRIRAAARRRTPAAAPAPSCLSSPSCSPSSPLWPPTACSSRSRGAASTWPTPAASSSRATRSAWRGR